MRDRRRRFGDGFAEYEADRKSTRLNSSHLVISYAVSFFRKNTRLNSSHLVISYAVFCLQKKTPTHCPRLQVGPQVVWTPQPPFQDTEALHIDRRSHGARN